MADTFNRERAAREQKGILEQAQGVRDSLTTQINRFWDRGPASEEERTRNRSKLYEEFRRAYYDLEGVLDKLR